MGLIDRMLDSLASVAPSTPRTIKDDAQSRLARQQRAERDRMQRVERDPETGEELLWFDVKVSSLGGYANVPIPWAGKSREDVRQSFIEWLESEKWHTVEFTDNGAHTELTFLTGWVSGFTVSEGRKRR